MTITPETSPLDGPPAVGTRPGTETPCPRRLVASSTSSSRADSPVSAARSCWLAAARPAARCRAPAGAGPRPPRRSAPTARAPGRSRSARAGCGRARRPRARSCVRIVSRNALTSLSSRVRWRSSSFIVSSSSLRGLELLVHRLELLVGRLELLVGRLELLVGRLELLVGRLELLDRRLQLLVGLLELPLGAGQLVLEPVAPRSRRS